VNVSAGELVSQNAAAFVLASRDREVDFEIPPADAAALPVGAPISFTLNGKSFPLSVTQSSDVPLNGVVALAAAVPASTPLSFGAIGTVSYSLTLSRGVLVPTGALQTNENRNFVYAVEGTKAMVRPITILAESGTAASVTGVNAGSLVVVNPPPGLLDGSVVKAIAK
jgi:HlyD family secretion protein